MTSTPQTAPAGLWQSPISAESLAQASLRLAHPVQFHQCTYWIEGRPFEGGRNVLVRRNADGEKQDVSGQALDVRSRVHEYGGSAYCLHRDSVFVVNVGDCGIYLLSLSDLDAKPRLIFQHDDMRFADLLVDELRNQLIAVMERHQKNSHSPDNSLIAIDLESQQLSVLHEGEDFYSSPTLNRDGSHLAFLSWNHPDMPWDQTRLHLAPVGTAGQVITSRVVLEGEAIFQPQFGPDDHLYFSSDRDNWWNLYALNVDAQSKEKIRQITHEKAEIGRGQWIFGLSVYGFVNSETIVAASVSQGLWNLSTVEIKSGQCTPIANWPFNTIEQLHVNGNECAVLCSGPQTEPSIVRLDIRDGTHEILQTTSSTSLDSNYLSEAQPIEYQSGGDATAHAFYYAPRNPLYQLPDGDLPPLIVTVHGGPTTASDAGLNKRFQYWTSRGFGVLDVNYRGSTGFGRDYRRQLLGKWGIADVEDCCHGALHIAALGLADSDQLFIMGGSAGGYTVLAALAFTDTFAAGVSLYGIGDLTVLINDTHKFEAHYTDSLIGPYEKSLYDARSPLMHADRISAPTLFFQGTEDKVVPPNQAESMFTAMRDGQVPTAYVSMQGEGHGFRRSDSIETLMHTTLDFFRRVMGHKKTVPGSALQMFNEDKL